MSEYSDLLTKVKRSVRVAFLIVLHHITECGIGCDNRDPVARRSTASQLDLTVFELAQSSEYGTAKVSPHCGSSCDAAIDCGAQQRDSRRARDARPAR